MYTWQGRRIRARRYTPASATKWMLSWRRGDRILPMSKNPQILSFFPRFSKYHLSLMFFGFLPIFLSLFLMQIERKRFSRSSRQKLNAIRTFTVVKNWKIRFKIIYRHWIQQSTAVTWGKWTQVIIWIVYDVYNQLVMPISDVITDA